MPGYNGSSTPLIQTISQTGGTLTYAYDDGGNILSVTEGTKATTYVYDQMGRLVRVNDPWDTTSGTNGTTWVYSYNAGGNLLNKRRYAYTTGTLGNMLDYISYMYTYGAWRDRMSSFNGTSISYDTVGNPTSDGTWNYTWAQGRQLKQMSKSGTTLRFAYNEDGMRVEKTIVNSTTVRYTLHGSQVMHLTNGTDTLHFFYDVQGKPAVVVFNGTPYAYLYNLQGDVIGLVDSSGTKVVEYRYDAWGKILSKTGSMSTTLGTVQPFRYRAYIYDEESGLYYLKSRYYNPSWCRFINADSVIRGNLFEYAENSPVNFFDPDGTSSVEVLNAAFIEFLYTRDAEKTFSTLLGENGGNQYLAFHEMAQILAGSSLYAKGDYNLITFEEAILSADGKHYEGDIVCYTPNGSKYIYEIKPAGISGIGQVNKYIIAGNGSYSKGEVRISSYVQLFDELTLFVDTSPRHSSVIWYSWKQQDRKLKNVEVKDIVKYIVAAFALGLLMADDALGFGAFDDFLIPPVMAIIGF